MKRSTAVVLVLSGAILSGAGCNKRPDPTTTASADGQDLGLKDPQTLTNDTYVAGRGYYHSGFHGFFPFPYNHYRPGLGYYRGGRYEAQPDLSTPRPTTPGRASAPDQMESRSQRLQSDASSDNARRGGFTRSHTGWSSRA